MPERGPLLGTFGDPTASSPATIRRRILYSTSQASHMAVDRLAIEEPFGFVGRLGFASSTGTRSTGWEFRRGCEPYEWLLPHLVQGFPAELRVRLC